MNNPKKQSQEKNKERNKINSQVNNKSEINDNLNQEQLNKAVQFWSEEIKQLKFQKFSSIEEAVSSIANKVVVSMNIDKTASEATVLFIEDLLLTDPIFSFEIKKALGLK